VPRLGYTLSDGVLTWRTETDTANVATGLPDDLDEILASNLGVVLARRGEAVVYFDYAGIELGVYSPEAIAPEEGGVLPDESVLSTLVPTGAREGVLVLEHTAPPDGTGTSGASYATVHEYRLDAVNALVVRMISDRTASTDPGHLGYHLTSEFVAWMEGSDTVAFHDTLTGETERVETERVMYFEAPHTPPRRHF